MANPGEDKIDSVLSLLKGMFYEDRGFKRTRDGHRIEQKIFKARCPYAGTCTEKEREEHSHSGFYCDGGPATLNYVKCDAFYARLKAELMKL